jgi:hypothetical protein
LTTNELSYARDGVASKAQPLRAFFCIELSQPVSYPSSLPVFQSQKQNGFHSGFF